jgi:hypothetical protein
MAVGCGGDDDDDAAGDDGGDVADDGGDENSDTTLDQLSAGEAQAFCEEVLDVFDTDDFVRFACTSVGLSQYPDDPDACNAAVDDCIEMQEIPAQEPVCYVDPEEVTALPECASEITLGELQTCLEAFYDDLVAALDAFTCDSSLEDPPELPTELPEECAAIQAACTELFE